MKVTNISQVGHDIDNWLKAVETETAAIAVGLAKYAFEYVLMVSPQYTGDFVANWNLSKGAPDTSFQPYGAFPNRGSGFRPHLMGDLAAVNEAVRRNRGALDGAKLGQTLWMANTAYHTEFYAFKIEDNQIVFRAGNMGEPVMRTLRHMSTVFGHISKSQAQGLIARSKK